MVTETDKANLLNSCFGNFFTVDDGNKPAMNSKVPENVILDFIHFTPVSIRKSIKKLKCKKVVLQTVYHLLFLSDCVMLYACRCLLFSTFPLSIVACPTFGNSRM